MARLAEISRNWSQFIEVPSMPWLNEALAGGFVLSVLNWFTAAILPPRYKQFIDPPAVVEAIRANVLGNDIYTAPQGLFATVSLRPRRQSWSSYRRPACCRVCGSVGLVSARTYNTTSLANTHCGFLGASWNDCWCRDTFSELELGRFSNKLCIGGECVPGRKLVYRWAGVGRGSAKAGGGGRRQMTCSPRRMALVIRLME